MIYNAEGEILLPFVTYKSALPDAVLKYFDKKITFFETDDGKMDGNALSLLVLSIQL